MDFLITLLTISLLSAFIISLLGKLKVIEKMQIHGNDFISELASCNFCLSWWTNLIVSIVAFGILQEIYILAIPFLGTMITRHIL